MNFGHYHGFEDFRFFNHNSYIYYPRVSSSTEEDVDQDNQKTSLFDGSYGFAGFLKCLTNKVYNMRIDDFVSEYKSCKVFSSENENKDIQKLAKFYEYLGVEYGLKRLKNAKKFLTEGKANPDMIDLFMEDGYIIYHSVDEGIAYSSVVRGYPKYKMFEFLLTK